MTAKQWAVKKTNPLDDYELSNQKAGKKLVEEGLPDAKYLTQYSSGNSYWTYKNKTYKFILSRNVIMDLEK
jgi:hypothetical protein